MVVLRSSGNQSSDGCARCVVVTGIGIVSPGGIGKEAFWDTLIQGRSCIGPIRHLEPRPGQRVHIAATVDGFSIRDYATRRQARFMERVSSFAYAAAKMAVEDAALTLTPAASDRAGTSIGTFAGPISMGREQLERIASGGIRKLNALTCIIASGGASFGNISVNLRLRGPGVTIYGSETAGIDALGYAYRQIKYGEADVMIAGGSEAPVIHSSLFLFDCLGLLSRQNAQPERASRPFDDQRDGFVLGEGAAVLVLEERTHALARGAHIYAEVAGYATRFAPVNGQRSSRTPSPASLAMQLALEEASLCPNNVDYVSAHGVSTRLGDRLETRAIKQTLGERAYDVPVSSIKSMLGHALGGASALQAASCCLVLNEGILPPTVNYERRDPACDLDYVPNEPRAAAVSVAVQNCFSFMGKNSVLVYKR